MSALQTSRRAPLVAVLGSLALTGCVDVDAADDLGPVSSEIDFRTIDPACPADRMIARAVNADGCPSIMGWVATSLLENGTSWLEARSLTIPDAAGHLCRYEAVAGAPLVLALEDFIDPPEGDPELIEVAPDCEIIHGQQASVLSSALGPMLRDLFHQQIDWVSPAELAGTEGQRSPVVVAVVDTMPNGIPSNPRSEHGESMARIIDDVACPAGGSCAVRIERTLGLPRYLGGVDQTRGGYVGSFGDLASAIVEAVERWREDPEEPALILSLSVGWESQWGGTSAAANAVQTALEYASCSGALIVTAAGNDNGLCQDGPLEPAAWEQLPAPGAARCSQLGVDMVGTTSGYRPLVHAVGGLGLDAGPMPGSRPESMPRIAATATHVVAGDASLTKELTGTSVAAAAVAGAAALVWSYNPAMQPQQVMRALHQGGVDQGTTADFQLAGASAQSVRRLDVCGALEWSCAQPQGCSVTTLDCSAPGVGDLEPVLAASEAIVEDHTVQPSFEAPVECGLVCEVPTSSTGSTCGETMVDQSAFVVSPQPNDPACPNCTLTNNTVRASLDPFYDGKTIEQVVVTVIEDGGRTQFDFGAVALTSAEVTGLVLDRSQSAPTIESATIGVLFDGMDWPVENELLLR